MVAVTTLPPTSRFSSAGVPRAAIRPWSSTTMSSASRSASSRYWVVSTTVVPRGGELVDDVPQHGAGDGSRPVVGSSRNSTDGEPTRLAARSMRRRDPPDSSPTRRSAMSSQVEPVDQLVGPARGRAAPSPVRRADQLEVLAAGEEVVEAGVLAGDADPAADLVGVGDDVEAVDQHPADGRAARSVVSTRIRVVLPAPLWPSTPSVVPGAHVEVDAGEGLHVAVSDVQVLDEDGGAGHRAAPRSGRRSTARCRRRASRCSRRSASPASLVGVVGEDGVDLPGAERDVGGVDPHLVLDGVAAAVRLGHAVAETGGGEAVGGGDDVGRSSGPRRRGG